MAQFKVTVNKYKDARRPKLKWVVSSYHPTDKKNRRRTFCETKEEADSIKAAREIEIQNFGVQAMDLTAHQRIEALDAFQKLAPFKITLTDAIRDYIDRRRSSTSTVSEVLALYIKSRERLGRSDRHLIGLRSVFRRFGEAHGTRLMVDVTADDVQDYIASHNIGARTKNHWRVMIHSVFQWAFMRKIIRENPIKQIEPHTVKAGKVGILNAAQMRALLTASAGQPDLVATFAIGGFAGIRPEEIARLSWSAIDFAHGQIDCAAEFTKTAKHRYVKIQPALGAWLKTITFGTGPIQGKNFKKRFDKVRKDAGFIIKTNEGITWPHDCLRHSFASYHLAKFGNPVETAVQLGHEDTSMLYRNYRARVSENDAEAWWSLIPAGGSDV